MPKSTVTLVVICLALLFVIAVIATSKPARPISPPDTRVIAICTSEVADNGPWALAVEESGIEYFQPACFSSKKDALAAADLLHDALKWADPNIHVISPPPD